MKIYIDPSELSTNSLLPKFDIESIPLPGLEELTGCDFIVSKFPLPPSENTIQAHIQSHALFCQRKSGYDFIGDFNQVFKEIARMQACNIPNPYILAIGHYKPDDDGLLRITGKKPLQNNRSITYDTFLTLEAEYRYSGCQVVKLNDESEIETWINAQMRELETIQNRDKRKELYPDTNFPIFEPGHEPDYLQEVEEIPDTDIRYFLARGLKGFGQTLANNLVEYADNETPQVHRWGLYAMKVLTDEDEKGKSVHKIKGWGNGKRKKFRDILGLSPGYNMSVREIEFERERAFVKGWQTALNFLEQLIRDGHESNAAFSAVRKMEVEFFMEDIKK